MQEQGKHRTTKRPWWALSARVALAAVAVGLAVFLLTFPLWTDNYWLRIATTILMFGVLAEAFGLITGFAGYPAFGNTAFFGLGAYTVAIVLAWGLWYPLAILLAGLVAVLVCVVVGTPILRLRGHYFAIATLGFAVATREIVMNMRSVTRGAQGWVLPLLETDPRVAGTTYFYWMLGIMVACFLTVWWVSRSRFGYGLRSIKAAEWEAASFGINTTRYKLYAWILSAFYVGLAGGVWALWLRFIDPASAFDQSFGVKFSIMAILGGLGTVAGPVVGAFIVESTVQLVWGAFLEYHMAALGAMIVLIILWVPGGLMAVAANLLRKWQ